MRFDFAHAHAVVTLTSHASILTGPYPFQHGLRDNSGYRLPAGRAHGGDAASSRRATRPAAFVGAFPLHSRFGLNQGFDVYDDHFGETRDADRVRDARTAGDGGRAARARLDRARGRSGRREPLVRVGASCSIRTRRIGRRRRSTRSTPAHPYDGEVAATDAALAPLLDDRARVASRPTLVVVTGDHGEALGDHGEQSHGLFAYESTLRVPLIIAEIGGSSAARCAVRASGEVSRVPARHVDILPTMLDAAGAAGRLPICPAARCCRPPSAARGAPPRTSYFEAMGGDAESRLGAAVRRARRPRQVHRSADCPSATTSRPIPAERDESGRTRRRSAIARSRPRCAASTAPPPGERLAEDADAAARLRALGYVSGSAPAKARYTEADDPKRLVDARSSDVHDAVEAFGARRVRRRRARSIEHIIARRPDMAIAYRHLAFVEWQRGDPAGAIDVLQRAVQAGVTDRRVVDAARRVPRRHAAAPREAIELLEPLARASDADADALNALGIAYAQAGRRERRGATFERVLADQSRKQRAAREPGHARARARRPRRRAPRFERAVARRSALVARARRSRRRRAARPAIAQRAIDEWTRAVQLDAANFDALYNARHDARARRQRPPRGRISSGSSGPRRRRSTRRI